jgi:8-amino-7-oxononanoate synthase
MLDFTSALYLGLQHPSESLRPWSQLTTGRPAALGAPASQERVAHGLAELQGCERAILGPSTLHLFWDLFRVYGEQGVAIYLDAGTYPIARWGVERAAGRGAPTLRFGHHDPGALERLLRRDAQRGLTPIVVADGFCPGCGEAAPIEAYLESVRGRGGYLVLDDTQALGILGHSPVAGVDYGMGGGGSLRWSSVSGPDIVMVSSLAKGFGVPVAVLAGDGALLRRFEAESETRLHSSPPSAAVVHAAERALAINQRYGEMLRACLAKRVRRFREALALRGLGASGGLFPVQTVTFGTGRDARVIHARLAALGIRAVLHAALNGRTPRLTFLITARHGWGDLDRAAEALAQAFAGAPGDSTLETTHGYPDPRLGILSGVSRAA